jgi:uncharacterized protein (DUF58 family)
MNTTFKTLQLKARHQVYTLLSGHNLSKLHGEGYDFSELREYQMGDDIRKINWTITAKLGKPYIKELHANRELSVVVSAFMDGGLYFGEGKAKQEKLVEIATLLGYATHQQSDLFTGIAYLENDLISTPPTKQLYTIEEFSRTLYESSLLATRVNKQEAVENLFKRIQKPSLLFVLGDYLDPIDLSLLAQKHEVIVVIIRHREEESPKKLGEVMLTNPQDKSSLETYFSHRSISGYLEKLMENDTNLFRHFSQYGIRYIKIYTDEDAIGKLLTLFG